MTMVTGWNAFLMSIRLLGGIFITLVVFKVVDVVQKLVFQLPKRF